jgi:hypothetical protein
MNETKIIGVYSPVKRCMQTTFCLALGRILAEESKVLYLNFETFSGFNQIMDRTYRSDITDMMYIYECIPEKFILKLATITEKLDDKLDYIAPSAVFPEMMNIPGRQWTKLLETLRSQSDY